MGPLETRSYRFDRFTLDLRAGCMRLGEAEVPLRPKSFEVLLYLVRNPGRLVSKGELIERVWPGIAVTENSLAQCIKDVREALGDREQAIVQTVAKRGYRFRPAVSEMDTAPAEAGPTEPSPTILAAAAQAPGPAPPSAERATRGYRRRVAALLAGGMTGVTAIAGGTWLALHRGAGTGTGSPAGQSRQRGQLSVAVLPLEAEAASPGDVLPKGISEDIATALGRFAEIAVASPGLVSRLSSA